MFIVFIYPDFFAHNKFVFKWINLIGPLQIANIPNGNRKFNFYEYSFRKKNIERGNRRPNSISIK